MFLAAANELAQMADGTRHGAPILPSVCDLREVSCRVAIAVARQAVADGLGAIRNDVSVEGAVRAAVWEPRYRPIRLT
jgi:malic enzyme